MLITYATPPFSGRLLVRPIAAAYLSSHSLSVRKVNDKQVNRRERRPLRHWPARNRKTKQNKTTEEKHHKRPYLQNRPDDGEALEASPLRIEESVVRQPVTGDIRWIRPRFTTGR